MIPAEIEDKLDEIWLAHQEALDAKKKEYERDTASLARQWSQDQASLLEVAMVKVGSLYGALVTSKDKKLRRLAAEHRLDDHAFTVLARDPCREVRVTVAMNKYAPRCVRELLMADQDEGVAWEARLLSLRKGEIKEDGK